MEVIKTIFRKKTVKKIIFGCSLEEVSPANSETDLILKKVFEKHFLKSEQPLTVHSSYYIGSLTALQDTFCAFNRRFYALGLQFFKSEP